MTELIAIQDLSRPFPVDARDLHDRLGVGRDFSTWIRERLDRFSFAEGADYRIDQSPNLGTGENGHSGGSPTRSYYLTVPAAKTFVDSAGDAHLISQTFVTGKGEVWLNKRFFRVAAPA